ncbi:HET-domain-containing protein [Aaosphaeria arxii CBS 175.79]|uniref:HET-domain-containing protein n=1 Tax=Aaosphaeria arxii CBS 175.79 TaxID=1450172 RepID=A0A6A5X6Y8_9PLEO|nr:HET-domain-containing protein [Aaosphaeria arxii CBS 175.79]KAF2008646.1 HET-domain-containing protein [Aaosphaeria arxii CBS 175.79]
MWLLNARTLSLEYFLDNRIPRYAILSHTWGDEEISFQDFDATKNRSYTGLSGQDPFQKKGWKKVEATCKKALEYECEYAWVDTCCIDKSSSSELQEAINSMFRWYKIAYTCFTYLEDVLPDDDVEKKRQAFRTSRWFTRGWTLQELIAPYDVIFFDHAWQCIGSKRQFPSEISRITGIKAPYLGLRDRPAKQLSQASVAERMSWAAKRQTTRKEDMAYCLLGIFDINMPMLYGEGEGAFIRLQEEIMKITNDNSLLCWGYKQDPTFKSWSPETMLAPNPGAFRHCKDVEKRLSSKFSSATFSMTQNGLSVKLPVVVDEAWEDIAYGILGCGLRVTDTGDGCTSFFAIPLLSTRANMFGTDFRNHESNEYLRPWWCSAVVVSPDFLKEAKTRDIIIRRYVAGEYDFARLPLSFNFSRSSSRHYSILGTYPPQPLGPDFLHLSTSGSSKSLPGAKVLYYDANSISQAAGFEDSGLVFIHVEIPFTALLIVLDWHLDYGSDSGSLQALGCRVFELPGEFRLEFLESLYKKKDFSSLPELSCSKEKIHLEHQYSPTPQKRMVSLDPQGRVVYKFHLPKNDNEALVIGTRLMKGYGPTTFVNVFTSVIDNSRNLQDLAKEMADHYFEPTSRQSHASSHATLLGPGQRSVPLFDCEDNPTKPMVIDSSSNR